jgi:hypothetical protein
MSVREASWVDLSVVAGDEPTANAAINPTTAARRSPESLIPRTAAPMSRKIISKSDTRTSA